MSNSKRETVDHWSFVDGVKSPLGRLADACMNAYEKNGDTLLVEAADALRAIETVDLECVLHGSETHPLPWRRTDTPYAIPIRDANDKPIWKGALSVYLQREVESDTIVECINTVHALQTKNGDSKPMSEDTTIINDCPDADEISEMVMECVRKNCYGDTSAFKVAEITRETNLWDDLSLDGLDMVELIMNVEDKLSQLPPYHSVSIPEDVCDEIETVGDFVDAVFRVMGVRE